MLGVYTRQASVRQENYAVSFLQASLCPLHTVFTWGACLLVIQLKQVF